MGARDACAWLLLASLLLVLPPPSTTEQLHSAPDDNHQLRCRYPFKAVRDECFYVSDVVVQLNFTEAREYCQGLGGDLARPARPYVLLSYLAEQDIPRRSVYENLYWLGARRDGTHQPFRWLKGGDSERLEDPGMWYRPAGNQPLLLPEHRPDDHCLYVSHHHDTQLWCNFPCSKRHRFVCEDYAGLQ